MVRWRRDELLTNNSKMTHVVLELADGRLEVELSLFASRPSCVVMLIHHSFPDKEAIVPLPDLTLKEFEVLTCVLEGRILETYLAPELLMKASKYGFTHDVVHYSLEHRRQKTSINDQRLDCFLAGGGEALLPLSKKKYESLKALSALPSNIIPTIVLMNSNTHISAIVAHDCVPIEVESRTTSSAVLEGEIDANQLRYQLCFQGLVDDGSRQVFEGNLWFDREIPEVGAGRRLTKIHDQSYDLPSMIYSHTKEGFLQGLAVAAGTITSFSDPRYYYSELCFYGDATLYSTPYETYREQLTPLGFIGCIKADEIRTIVRDNVKLLTEEVNRRHDRAQIVNYQLDKDAGDPIYLSVYTACYALVRL